MVLMDGNIPQFFGRADKEEVYGGVMEDQDL